MAILQQTREKFGLVISIIIALALLSFIIDPNTLQTAFQAMSSKNDVGEIGGKSISYLDFQSELEKFNTVNELVTGTSSLSEQQQEQINNATWQSLVDKYLFIKNAKAGGIKVGRDEMTRLLSGDMVSPVIANNPVFYDEDGNFSKEALQNLIQNAKQDQTGKIKTYLDYIQNAVYTQQFYSKYGNIFTQGNFQNPLMVKRAVDENNITSTVDMVLVPASFTKDSSIVVSDSEIKEYYKNHKKFFKQNASRDIEYVVYEVKPSEDDINATNEAVSEIYDEFGTTTNIKSFLARNSELSLSDHWYKDKELNSVNQEINDFVFGNAEGVSPIFSDGEVFYAAKILSTAQIPDSVYVRHILLQGDNEEKADSLLSVVNKGGNFSNIAVAYSSDTRSAVDGELGNIGWMTQNDIDRIPDFKPVLTAKAGVPFLLKTTYGTHIIDIVKRTVPITKKQVAILQKTAVASLETFNDYYSKANKFSTMAAGSYSNYLKAVDSLGVYSHAMNNVLEKNSAYGGIERAKEVTRWIYDNKAGKVSDIITVNNNYFFVVALKAIHKEGTAPLGEVKDMISEQLYAQKASEKLGADVAGKIAGLTDLEAIAEALGTTVSRDVEVRFSTMAGQGLDGKLIGAVSAAPENKLCGPVAGNIGTYMFVVKSRETGSYYTEEDAKNASQQMNSYATQMLLPIMMNDADVKDNRARFY